MLTASTATFFGATSGEMSSANESVDDAAKLAEGGGFLASLGVYHEIHCLVRPFITLSNESKIWRRAVADESRDV